MHRRNVSTFIIHFINLPSNMSQRMNRSRGRESFNLGSCNLSAASVKNGRPVFGV